MDNKNLSAAFKALRKKGYFAEEEHTCCNTCGWAEIPHKSQDKVVFYHQQEIQSRDRGNPFHLNWAGDPKEIMDTFKEFNVVTSWDGNYAKKITVESW